MQQSRFDLCVELRKTPETADSLIIALSGLTYPGIEATAAEAGFDHYFLKPISMEMLMKTVDLLDHQAGAHPPQTGGYAAASDASDIVSGPPTLVFGR